MERIKQLIHELTSLLNTIAAATVVINGLVIFFALYFLLAFIRFRPLLALFPTLLYIGLTLARRLPAQKLDIVEGKYPFLRGKLTTASDNRDAESPIAEELEEECITDIRNIRASDFIDLGALAKKTAMIISLGFAILLISSFNISLSSTITHITDYLGIAGALRLGGEGEVSLGDAEQPFELYDQSATEAFLGEEALSLEIPVPQSVKVDEVEAAKERDFEETFPEELFSQGSEANDEAIAAKHKDIIKEYFSSVSKR